jgi:hypothetical protein
MQHKNIFLLAFCIISLIGCTYNQLNTCNKTNITYNSNIKAIMTTNCATASCHAGSNASAGIRLDDYANTKGFAEQPSFMGSITHDGTFSNMPKGGAKLDDCTISQLQAWITAGYPQ